MIAHIKPQRFVAAALALAAAFATVRGSAGDAERFGLFTATLDGGNVRRILSDPQRELNHAHVSPDGKWITFTRYNRRAWNGIARETGGYAETEIMLARIDGSGLRSLVPPRKGIAAANGSWSEDGKAILYVSTDNPGRRGQINRIDVATGRVAKVPLPGDPWAADPHARGAQLAISVFDPVRQATAIWLADLENTRSRQITHPSVAGIDPAVNAPLGDFDPKLSPDGSRLVAMRNLGRHNWHIVSVDLGSGAERDLSAARTVDGVPEWSSDGRKLVFWHVDTADLEKSGLYTMNPEGRERKRIPLPRGHFYTLPAFFPGDGSGRDARIIFSAEKNPLL